MNEGSCCGVCSCNLCSAKQNQQSLVRVCCKAMTSAHRLPVFGHVLSKKSFATRDKSAVWKRPLLSVFAANHPSAADMETSTYPGSHHGPRRSSETHTDRTRRDVAPRLTGQDPPRRSSETHTDRTRCGTAPRLTWTGPAAVQLQDSHGQDPPRCSSETHTDRTRHGAAPRLTWTGPAVVRLRDSHGQDPPRCSSETHTDRTRHGAAPRLT